MIVNNWFSKYLFFQSTLLNIIRVFFITHKKQITMIIKVYFKAVTCINSN